MRQQFIGLILLLAYTGHAQEAMTLDTSMTLAEFRDNFDQAKDEIWIADFWASWCGPCMRSMPYVKEMHDKFKDDLFNLICAVIGKK